MSFKKSDVLFFSLLITTTFATFVEAQHVERPLLLSRHTMEFGGKITLDTHIEADGDPDDGDTYAKLVFSPSMGYFVIDNFEIIGAVISELPFNDNPKSVGFNFGLEYIWDFHVICLYLGGTVGVSWAIGDWSTSPEAFIDPTLLFGILVPFNRHVAMDVGTQLQFHFPVDEDNPNDVKIDIPIGYLGIRGHFNFVTGG